MRNKDNGEWWILGVSVLNDYENCWVVGWLGDEEEEEAERHDAEEGGEEHASGRELGIAVKFSGEDAAGDGDGHAVLEDE